MDYKLSSFNYIFNCDDGSLRLYNSMYGSNSLMIVTPEIKDDILFVLNDINHVKNISECMKNELVKHGYLISKDKNEEYALKINNAKTILNEKYLQLIIMPTEQCNFRCKYCYETFEKGKMSIQLQDAIIRYVQKNILNYIGLSVTWFGGEPLMALDVIEYLSDNFIKICKSAKRTYMSGMTTNGYNLTPDIFEKLYKLKILSYQITIDGFKTQHDNQRVFMDGSGTFDRIVDNLIKIKQVKAFGAVFNIRTNYTKSIIENIDAFLEFYKQTFGDDSRFGLYIQQAADYGGNKINNFYDQLLSSNHTLVLKKMKEYGITLGRLSHFNELNCEISTCYAAKENSYVIGSDGTIYKCTVHFDMPDNNVGNLDENGYMHLNDNLRKWINPFYNAEKKCKGCFNRANCLPMKCPYAIITLNNLSCPPMGKENLGAYIERFDDSLFFNLL